MNRTPLFAILALLLATPLAHADQFDEVCGDLMGGSGKSEEQKAWEEKSAQLQKAHDDCMAQGGSLSTCPVPLGPYVASRTLADAKYRTNKGSYCAAYLEAQKGKHANDSLVKMYAVATVACVAACAMPITVPAAVCYAPSGVAVVMEMLKAKDMGQSNGLTSLMNGLTGGGGGGTLIGGAGALALQKGAPTQTGYVMAKGGGVMTDQKTGKDLKTTKSNKTACYTAIFDAMQVMSKQKGSQDASATAKKALEDAAALPDPRKIATDTTPTTTTTTTPGATTNAAKVTTAYTYTNSDPCASAPGSVQGTINCAVASDTNMAEIAKHTDLMSNFAQATGNDPKDFIAKGDFSPKAMASALPSSLGSGASSSISAALAKVEPENGVPSEPAKTEQLAADTYQGGHGAGEAKKAGASADDSMSSALETMMSQLGGAKPGANPQRAAIEFTVKTQGYAAVSQQRNFSIFNLVSTKYEDYAKQWDGNARAPASATPPSNSLSPQISGR